LINNENFKISWRLEIWEDNHDYNRAKPLPMRFKIRQLGAGVGGTDKYLLGSSTTYDPLPASPGKFAFPALAGTLIDLNAASTEKFVLDWEWAFEENTNIPTGDARATELGEFAGAEDKTVMPYYRLFFNMFAQADDVPLRVYWRCWNPATEEYEVIGEWDISVDDLGKTIKELMEEKPDKYYIPTPPSYLDNYDLKFKGWFYGPGPDGEPVQLTDADGKLLDDSTLIDVLLHEKGKDYKPSEGHEKEFTEYPQHFDAYGEYSKIYRVYWKYLDPSTNQWVTLEVWIIDEEDLGKTIAEIIASDKYPDYKKIPEPPTFPGFVFTGWKDVENAVVTNDTIIRLLLNAKYDEFKGKYVTSDPTKPSWWPWVLLPIPLVGLLLIPLIPLLSLLPLSLLLPLLPFLPSWIAKLVPVCRCGCTGGCCADKCSCENGDDTCCKKPNEKPPKTGEISLLPVYVLLAISTGTAVLVGKKRKKDDF
jgi:hypothetical protein